MRFEQPAIPTEKLTERFRIVKTYLDLTREMHQLAFPNSHQGFGSHMETLLVLMCVFIGDVEGRPMSASKIANQIGLPRPSVYRRLAELLAAHKIVKLGKLYYYQKGSITPDLQGKLSRIAKRFCA